MPQFNVNLSTPGKYPAISASLADNAADYFIFPSQKQIFSNIDKVNGQEGPAALALPQGNATITPAQCSATMQHGADRWCGLEFYDQLKCQCASEMANNSIKSAAF
jgi:hypothetical protein